MNHKTPTRGATRRVASTVLIVLASLVLLGSATAKLAHVPNVVEELSRLGFEGNKLTIIALLEVLSAVLFLAPASRSLGLLLVSAYLGGAIATHVQHDDSPLPPAVILALIWAGAWLRPPRISLQEQQKCRGESNSVEAG